MKIYLVGGAVRDELLGIPFVEKDYVVVGSTIEEMVKNNFKPVGKDFPVFIHPKTFEEYALARTEKKEGVGYKGFKFYTSPKITLEEDLKRRDLTINAIAKDESGKIIDPFNGVNDISNKVLRHISTAFSEDPLRILRVCRFQAKFIDFQIDNDTKKYLLNMVANKELQFLSVDRIMLELKKVFLLRHGYIFFKTLHDVGGSDQLFTTKNQELNNLSECFKPYFMSPFFLKVRFNLLWLYFQNKFSFILNKNYVTNFSKKDQAVIDLFFKLQEKLENFSALSINEKYKLLKDIGFFGRDDKLNEILLLFQLNADAHQIDVSKILIYFDHLHIHFASQPISLPKNISGLAINEYLTKKRIELLNIFQF
ncbi:MAG: hypothetical protein O2959_00040 [Proteobacteria bacterium]|nr:hypothetical protein [Pseudomonadota bacterium]